MSKGHLFSKPEKTKGDEVAYRKPTEASRKSISESIKSQSIKTDDGEIVPPKNSNRLLPEKYRSPSSDPRKSVRTSKFQRIGRFFSQIFLGPNPIHRTPDNYFTYFNFFSLEYTTKTVSFNFLVLSKFITYNKNIHLLSVSETSGHLQKDKRKIKAVTYN